MAQRTQTAAVLSRNATRLQAAITNAQTGRTARAGTVRGRVRTDGWTTGRGEIVVLENGTRQIACHETAVVAVDTAVRRAAAAVTADELTATG